MLVTDIPGDPAPDGGRPVEGVSVETISPSSPSTDSVQKSKRYRCKIVSALISILAIGGFLAILFLVILKKPPAPRSGYVPADPFQAIPKSIGTTKTGARVFEQKVKALNVDGIPLSYKYQAELAPNVFSIEEFHQDNPTMRIQVHECEPTSVLVEFDAAKADNYTSTFLSSSLRSDNVLVGGAQHKCATPSSAEEGFYRKILGVKVVNSTVYETLEGPYEKSFYALQTEFIPQEKCFQNVKMNLDSLDGMMDNYYIEPDAEGYSHLVEGAPEEHFTPLSSENFNENDYDAVEMSNSEVTLRDYIPKTVVQDSFETMNACSYRTTCSDCVSYGCGWCSATRSCMMSYESCERPKFTTNNLCPNYDARLESRFESGTILALGHVDQLVVDVHSPSSSSYTVSIYEHVDRVRCSPADSAQKRCSVDKFIISNTHFGSRFSLNPGAGGTYKARYFYVKWTDGQYAHSNSYRNPPRDEEWLYIIAPSIRSAFTPYSQIPVTVVYSRALAYYEPEAYLYLRRRVPLGGDYTLSWNRATGNDYFTKRLPLAYTGTYARNITWIFDVATQTANPVNLPHMLAAYFQVKYDCDLGLCVTTNGRDIFFPTALKEYNWPQSGPAPIIHEWSTGGSTETKRICSATTISFADRLLCELEKGELTTKSELTCSNCYLRSKFQFNRLLLDYDLGDIYLVEASFNTSLDMNIELKASIELSYERVWSKELITDEQVFKMTFSIGPIPITIRFSLDLDSQTTLSVKGRGEGVAWVRKVIPNSEYIAQYGQVVPGGSRMINKTASDQLSQSTSDVNFHFTGEAIFKTEILPKLKMAAAGLLFVNVTTSLYLGAQANFSFPASPPSTVTTYPYESLFKFGSCAEYHLFTYKVSLGFDDIHLVAVFSIDLDFLPKFVYTFYNDSIITGKEVPVLAGCFGRVTTTKPLINRRFYLKPGILASKVNTELYKQRLYKAIAAAGGISPQRFIVRAVNTALKTTSMKFSSTSTRVLPMAETITYIDVSFLPKDQLGSERSPSDAVALVQQAIQQSTYGPLYDIDTYKWVSSRFSTCSCSSATPQEYFTVQCVDSKQQVADDRFCDGTKPPTVQSCVCDHRWNAGAFGACSKNCDVGQWSRTVDCRNASGSVVADYSCVYYAPGVRPAETESCDVSATMCTYSYSYGEWGACDCTTSTRSRSSWCVDSNGSAVDSAKCANAVNNNSESCVCAPTEPPVVVTYSWEYSSWSACQSCTSQTRTAVCVSSMKQVVEDTNCDVNLRETLSKSCSCGYSWKTGTFGACSSDCATGIWSRTVTCERGDGVAVDETFCYNYATESRPAETSSCNVAELTCTYSYAYGVWNKCGCRVGQRTRSSWCVDSEGSPADAAKCVGKENINVEPCECTPEEAKAEAESMPQPAPSDGGSSNAGMIAGIIGAVCGVLVIAIIASVCYYTKRKNAVAPEPEPKQIEPKQPQTKQPESKQPEPQQLEPTQVEHGRRGLFSAYSEQPAAAPVTKTDDIVVQVAPDAAPKKVRKPRKKKALSFPRERANTGTY